MSIKDFFNSCKDDCCVEGNASFKWSLKGSGFGGLYFYQKNGKTHCDNECMSKETVRKIMNILIDNCEFDNS